MILFKAFSGSAFQSFFELFKAVAANNSKKGFLLRSGLGHSGFKMSFFLIKNLALIIFFFSIKSFSQQQGLRDKDCATTKEINATANENWILKAQSEIDALSSSSIHNNDSDKILKILEDKILEMNL